MHGLACTIAILFKHSLLHVAVLHCSWGQRVKKNAMQHGKEALVDSKPAISFSYFCLLQPIRKMAFNTHFCRMRNTVALNYAKKVPILVKNVACTMLMATWDAHLKWGTCRNTRYERRIRCTFLQQALYQRYILYSLCTSEKWLTTFTQVVCFWPLLHLEELRAQLNPALNRQGSARQQKPFNGLTFWSKKLVTLWIS